MINNKGKGLNPEQLEKFLRNEESFKNDFLAYMKKLTDPREIEFAQLRRKYQSSFEDRGDFTANFSHRFTNPDEFSEVFSKTIKKNGILEVTVVVSEDFLSNGCEFLIRGDFNEEFKTAFEVEIKGLSVKFGGMFRTLKYLDTHVQMVSAGVINSVKEVKNAQRRAQLEKMMLIAKNTKGKKEIIEEVPKVEEKKEEKKKEEIKIEKKNENQEDSEEEEEEGNYKDAVPAHKKYTNVSISGSVLKINAKQLTFHSLGSASLTAFSIELSCARCSSRKLCRTSLSEVLDSLSNPKFTYQTECECTFPMSFEIAPSIIFAKSGKQLALGKFSGCSPLDLLEIDYKFTCAQCGSFIPLTNSHSYIPYIINCRECFSKGTFQLDGLDFAETKNVKTDEKASFIGKPLPKNGICKHFKNSYRWFKFPCCQRLFACMTCHDENTDHPSVKAEIYLCGFCGSLQKFGSKDVCKKCGGSVNGLDGSKQFWEGGKGCRNVGKMNKNEKRKHRVKK